MNNAIENTRFIMCNALNQIRKAKKHPRLLDIFENAMEAHLEALRVERGDLAVNLDHARRMTEVYSEAFEGQKMRTHNALCEGRRFSDDLWETRRELASVQNDREEGHDKLQDAIAKLAQQTQTIIALHRVIKDQQAAQDRLQHGLDEVAVIINRDKATAYSEAEEAHRQIMQAEAVADERWEQLEEKQKTIVLQRKLIGSLVSQLVSAQKKAEKRSFWSFLSRKPTQAKKLQK